MRATLPFLLLLAITARAADGVYAEVRGERPVQMQPFTVAAPGIDIKVLYDKNQRVARIEVSKVLPGSRAEKAGVTTSMWIIKIQGVEVRGLTKDELSKTLHRPVHDVHLLAVVDSRNRERVREIAIPIAKDGPK